MRKCQALALLCLCMCPLAWAQGVATPTDIDQADAAAIYTMPGAEAELASELKPQTPQDIAVRAQWYYQNSNFDDAFVLFKQAADQGDAFAQYMTGRMLSRGEGVPLPNDDEAARYMIAAAQQGYPQAQRALGMMYYNGTSALARDNAEAYKWFYLSSLQGDARAYQMLAQVQKELNETQPATAQAVPQH